MPRNNGQRRRYRPSPKQNRIIVILAIVVIALLAVIAFILFKNNHQEVQEQHTEEVAEAEPTPEEKEVVAEMDFENFDEYDVPEPERVEGDTTVVLSAVGDIMCHNTQYQDALTADGKYDFSYVFSDIKYYTQTADLTVGNLETTFGGEAKQYSSYPKFNTPDQLASTLKNLGFDLLATANNHCLDTGFDGLERTIDILDKSDISHLGTYKTQNDRDKVAVEYAKGLKFAFINYTYGTNGNPVPADKPFSVNLIDKNVIASDIEKAKAEKPDMIVAIMHWGQEYQTTPNAEQNDLADFLFKNGVDIVLGSHPHVLQPMEKRTVTLDDGSQKDGFIVYSLGNFSADQKDDNTKSSAILNISITKHKDGSLNITKADYVPIHMFKYADKPSQKFKLLDLERTVGIYEAGNDLSLGAKNYEYLKGQLANIKNILGAEITS